MNKKLLTTILSLTCAAMLFGCGSSVAGPTAGEKTDAAGKTDAAEKAEKPDKDKTEKPDKKKNKKDKEARDVEEPDENEWDGGPDFVSNADRFCDLCYTMELEEMLYTYSLSFVDDGKYADFEGDIGDVIPEYKDVDLDGDKKSDVIKREGKHYVIEFSKGDTITTDDFSASPNEGEIIEFCDMANRNADEILIAHYTFSTGGPVVWDTVIYSNASGKWRDYPVIDKDGDINSSEFKNMVGERTGEDFDPSNIRIAGCELSDGIVHLLVDFGHKEGPEQTFNYDAATLYMWFDPDHIMEYEEYDCLGFSKVALINTWPFNVGGEPVEMTDDLRYKLNVFLSNFSEQNYRGNGNYDPAAMAHFAMDWTEVNKYQDIEYIDGYQALSMEKVNKILEKYFGCILGEEDYIEIESGNVNGGFVKDGYYCEIAADGEMYKYNRFTVCTGIEEVADEDYELYRLSFTVFALPDEDYDEKGIGREEYSLDYHKATELSDKGKLIERESGSAIVCKWDDSYRLWYYYPGEIQ